jgi:LDH2 family malate/lactate/ureidoglycolate dehydrogenase
MQTYPAESLRSFVATVFEAAGVPSPSAAVVANSLVEADLRGIESHGVMRAARYVGRIKSGALAPDAHPALAAKINANAVVDGGWGFGQVAARFGVSCAIRLCREHGQAGVSIARAHHVGRIGEYAEELAAAGFAAIVMSGGGERGGSVAPYGSRKRAIGTNPLAMAVPTPAGVAPLVLDFATSMIPEGRVAVSAANQQPVPPGCLIDRDGRATTDPNSFRNGGALLPFGGHKGSAIAIMIEILATTLARNMPISAPDFKFGNPTLLLAWSIENFTPMNAFHRHVENLVAEIKSAPPADGFNEVMLPGELEARRRSDRMKNGIPISDPVWTELCEVAQSLGVSVPVPPKSSA